MKTIDRTELDRWTDEEREYALLDVLPDDAAGHSSNNMPHAHNSSDFTRQMEQLQARKDQPVVLYEAPSATVRSSSAADMLEHAGFANVYRFVGPQAAHHTSDHGLPVQSRSA